MTTPRSEYQRFGTRERDKEILKGLSLDILVVDDEPLILRPLSLCLEDSNHRVTTALSGQKALDLLRGKPFDLVITDLKMPGMDGITLLRRAKEIRPETKVILMTASVLSESTRRLVFEEADGFLPKPFSFAELHRAVSSCLNSEIMSPGHFKQDSPGSLEALAP